MNRWVALRCNEIFTKFSLMTSYNRTFIKTISTATQYDTFHHDYLNSSLFLRNRSSLEDEATVAALFDIPATFGSHRVAINSGKVDRYRVSIEPNQKNRSDSMICVVVDEFWKCIGDGCEFFLVVLKAFTSFREKKGQQQLSGSESI